MENLYSNLAKVAQRIDGYKFVINRGSAHGINVGDQFLVFCLGDNISDPDTGEDLGALEIVKGRARVAHVQEKISTLESSEKETIPGTIRKVRRKPGYCLLALAIGPREEEIEEGTEVRRRTISVEVGDMVRPI